MTEFLVVATHDEKGAWIGEAGFETKEAADDWVADWATIFAGLGVSLEVSGFRKVDAGSPIVHPGGDHVR